MGHWKDYYGWPRYVPVAERRAKAEKQMKKMAGKGQAVSPVKLDGKCIARTFWGKSWCENLERYSDYSNRLPRGRSYVRNGSVVDLQIGPGEVRARVAGSSLYTVTIKVAALPKSSWKAICHDCSGGIDSLVELLQGRFSKGVMERICLPQVGLFPAPAEIKFDCSCPDWATMCKHVAATLYGVGSRLDHQPELLFRLRQVDEKELIAHAGSGVPLSRTPVAAEKVLAADGLGDIFGLELAAPEPEPAKAASLKRARRTAAPPAPPAAAPKRRGRPPKIKVLDAGLPATPVAAEPALTPPKRRGRPPKRIDLDPVPAAAPRPARKKTGRRKKPVGKRKSPAADRR